MSQELFFIHLINDFMINFTGSLSLGAGIGFRRFMARNKKNVFYG